MPPIKELLQKKWQKTGRPYIWILAILYVIYMICVSLCCANRPIKLRQDNATDPRDITLYVQKTLQEAYVTPEDFLRLVGEMISVVGACSFLLIEISLVYKVGARCFISHTLWKDPFHLIRLSFSCLILVLLIMRLTNTNGEVVPMSVALVFGWCYVMYFARGFQMVGPFTIMIQKLAASDLLKFCWLMAVVVVGYSTALYIVFQPVNQTALGAFYPYMISFESTYQLFLNILNGPANYDVDLPEMYSLLYGSFCVIAFLLMFNLLIAMLGDTQAVMAKKKEELWKAQVTATTVTMDRRFPKHWCFGSGSNNHDLEERHYLIVEERRWHPTQPHETSDSSEESDEDTAPQNPAEDDAEDDHDPFRREMPTDEPERVELEQSEESTWEEEIHQL